MNETITLIVADDHPVVRAGIVGVFEAEPEFEVVAAVGSGEDAARAWLALQPDVILMDLRMPGIGGVEATRCIVSRAEAGRRPGVLVFTTYEDDDQILSAIEAGASGYLLKAAPASELIAGVRAVAAGQTVLAPSIAEMLAARVEEGAAAETAAAAEHPRLTPRETQILSLVAEGLSNREIGEQLFVGESTVKTHLVHVFEKLEVNDRTRAVTRSIELGLI